MPWGPMDARAEFFYSNIANLYGNTALRPLALAVTLCMGVALLAVPKKNAVIPIFVVMLAVTGLQRVVVLALDFSMVRLVVLFGWARVILRAETSRWKMTRLDSAVLMLCVSQAVFHTLQRRDLQAIVSSAGGAFDTAGLYFLFRLLIPDFAGASVAARAMALLAIPIAVLMVVEQSTGRNLFSVFGGVPEYTYVREGRLRSQASFSHPILAGTFGATLVPLLMGTWRMGATSRKLVVAGILSALIITFTSSSSGPLFALLMGVAAVAMWRFSEHMREVRLLVLLAFVGLELVMKAPVYALFARVPLMSGSTGYYRFLLIDAFVRHYRDWWLLGVPSTAYWGEGLFDITNGYIRVAVDGGLFTLILFMLTIVTAYRELGLALRTLALHARSAERFFLWGLGASLFSHLVSLLSVSYFDQIIVVWYMLLAVISTLSECAVVLDAARAGAARP